MASKFTKNSKRISGKRAKTPQIISPRRITSKKASL